MSSSRVQMNFFAWLDDELRDGLASDVTAVNFDISEVADGFVVSMIAANAYDPDDGDWASSAVVFRTKRSFRELTYELLGTTEWQQGEMWCAKLVVAYLESTNSILCRFPVSVGFVDGTLRSVWPGS